MANQKKAMTAVEYERIESDAEEEENHEAESQEQRVLRLIDNSDTGSDSDNSAPP